MFLDTWKWFGTPNPKWNSQNSDLLQYQQYLKFLSGQTPETVAWFTFLVPCSRNMSLKASNRFQIRDQWRIGALWRSQQLSFHGFGIGEGLFNRSQSNRFEKFPNETNHRKKTKIEFRAKTKSVAMANYPKNIQLAGKNSRPSELLYLGGTLRYTEYLARSPRSLDIGCLQK